MNNSNKQQTIIDNYRQTNKKGVKIKNGQPIRKGFVKVRINDKQQNSKEIE